MSYIILYVMSNIILKTRFMNKKINCNKVLLSCLFFVWALTSYAQVKKISGKVVTEDNSPLAGVTVLVKGKNTNAVTDASGTFSIQASNKDVLVFEFVGYASQEVVVTGNTIATVVLKSSVSKLDEVVVVGYGTQKRKEVTGAISSVNALSYKYTPSANVGTVLQGTVPGLLVQQTTGAPGSTPTIAFRGGTGFDGSGTPMVVLDGVVVPSLYGIDMNDVESIDVLKDAASTAIYGARAANGVILVTTKKGKKGRTQIQYTVRQTFNEIRTIGQNYMSAADYLRMNRLGIQSRYLADSLDGNVSAMNADKGQLNGAWGWAFGTTNPSQGGGLYTTQRVSNTNRQYLTDPNWKLLVDPNPFFPSQSDSILYKDLSATTREGMIVKSTPTIEHNVLFSGANDQGAFALSLSSLTDNGIIIGSTLKRMSLNFNGGLNVGKNFKLSLNTSAYNVNTTSPYTDPGSGSITSQSSAGLLQRFVGVSPTVRYSNDTSGAMLPGPNDNTLGNPAYWSTLYVNNNNEQRFTGSLNAEYTILPYLKVIASTSGFMRYGGSNAFTKSYIQGNGGSLNTTRPGSFSNYNDIQYSYNAFLQFDKQFKDHKLTVMAGGEYLDYKRYIFSGSAQGAPTDLIPWLTADPSPTIINGALAYPGGASSDFVYWERLASAIARVNYSYANKYYVQAVVRYDGSSRLNSNNFYGTFPGISVGWNLHNENFYKNSKLANYITTIKPRIGYGVNGNLYNFGNSYFPTALTYSSAGIYNGMGGTYAGSYINPNLRWERTNSTNFGIDLGILRNRITISADYFVKNVFDKLASLPISAQTGFTGFTTNLSQLQNKGFEATVNAKILTPSKADGLSLDAGFTFYTVKSYAVKLPFNGLPGNRQGTIQVYDPNNPGQFKYVNGLIEGQRIGYDEVWAPKWDGIYRTAADLAAGANTYNAFLPYNNKRTKQLGDAIWHQVYNNDTINQYQYVYVGRTTPQATGSFFFNLGYKNFHLYTAFDYAYRFVILNNTKLRGLSQVQGSQNGTVDVLNTWTVNNPNAPLPRFYWANQGRNYATDASGNNPPANMWEKGDYIALRELTLNYQFTPEMLTKAFNNKVKGISLFVTGSNLVYFTKYSGTFPEVGGFDNGRYPLPRRLTLGAQLTF